MVRARGAPGGLAQGDARGADGWSADSLAIARRVVLDATRSADVGQAEPNRALVLARLGRSGEATTHASLALTALRNGLGAQHAETREAEKLLASLAPAGTVRR